MDVYTLHTITITTTFKYKKHGSQKRTKKAFKKHKVDCVSTPKRKLAMALVASIIVFRSFPFSVEDLSVIAVQNQ